MRQRIHLRRDDGEAYCGLRMLPEARLTEAPARSGCRMCIEAYHLDGRPTPRISDITTPLVDVEGALEAQRELDRYVRDIREHDAAHGVNDIDQELFGKVPLPRGIRGRD